MQVSSQQLRLDTQNKTAELQGYKGGARQLLREMAADLVGSNGTIRSGYLRLSESGSQVKIKAGHMGSGATAATGLIKDLVKQAYGEQASAALEAYLNGKRSGHNKVGTQSFVKLIKKLESDLSEFRFNAIDVSLRQASVSATARLSTDLIEPLKLAPHISSLLGQDVRQEPVAARLEANWLSGLQKLYPGSQITFLGRGGEGVAFEISDEQGTPRVYKAKPYADDLNETDERTEEVASIYSSGLRQSPYLLTPTHFVMGYISEDSGDTPVTVVRVPAERVKELAKESRQLAKESEDIAKFEHWSIFGLEMPKAAGPALEEQEGALTRQDLSQIARGLHAGLSDMALHNAIHCDIKPANVMYSPADGRVQLIDFGGMVKLSKKDAQAGQRPLAKKAPASTPGFSPPWNKNRQAFGVERDRYAAAMTLLAAALNAPKDNNGQDATVSTVIVDALRQYRRAAERPMEVLDDILAQIQQDNPAMHAQLDSHLQRGPQFRDYLSKMFASAVPGPEGDALWEQLKGHPFVNTTPISRAMDAAELTTPEAARARADKTLSFFKTASEKDFRDLNAISGSTLVWAVHADATLADTRLPMAQREQRFRELEALYHQQHPAVKQVRDPAVETEEEFAQSVQQNLEAAAISRAHALTQDLALLSDPDRCALLNRTVVQAKGAGLKAELIDILGRGSNFQDFASVTDQRVDDLIARLFGRQELNQNDVRVARMLFTGDK